MDSDSALPGAKDTLLSYKVARPGDRFHSWPFVPPLTDGTPNVTRVSTGFASALQLTSGSHGDYKIGTKILESSRSTESETTKSEDPKYLSRLSQDKASLSRLIAATSLIPPSDQHSGDASSVSLITLRQALEMPRCKHYCLRDEIRECRDRDTQLKRPHVISTRWSTKALFQDLSKTRETLRVWSKKLAGKEALGISPSMHQPIPIGVANSQSTGLSSGDLLNSPSRQSVSSLKDHVAEDGASRPCLEPVQRLSISDLGPDFATSFEETLAKISTVSDARSWRPHDSRRTAKQRRVRIVLPPSRTESLQAAANGTPISLRGGCFSAPKTFSRPNDDVPVPPVLWYFAGGRPVHKDKPNRPCYHGQPRHNRVENVERCEPLTYGYLRDWKRARLQQEQQYRGAARGRPLPNSGARGYDDGGGHTDNGASSRGGHDDGDDAGNFTDNGAGSREGHDDGDDAGNFTDNGARSRGGYGDGDDQRDFTDDGARSRGGYDRSDDGRSFTDNGARSRGGYDRSDDGRSFTDNGARSQSGYTHDDDRGHTDRGHYQASRDGR